MEKLIKIFFAPEELFKQIKSEGFDANPLFIIGGINIIVTILYTKFVILPYRESIMMQQELPPQAMEKAVEFMSSPAFYAVSAISSLIGFILTTLVISGIYYLIATLLKGKGDFLKFWSGGINIYMISILGSIVMFPIAMIKQTPQVNLDFSILFQFLDKENFIRVFLKNATNIFSLWSVYLYGLLLNIIGEIEKKTSMVISFGMLLFYALIVSILKTLF